MPTEASLVTTLEPIFTLSPKDVTDIASILNPGKTSTTMADSSTQKITSTDNGDFKTEITSKATLYLPTIDTELTTISPLEKTTSEYITTSTNNETETTTTTFTSIVSTVDETISKISHSSRSSLESRNQAFIFTSNPYNITEIKSTVLITNVPTMTSTLPTIATSVKNVIESTDAILTPDTTVCDCYYVTYCKLLPGISIEIDFRITTPVNYFMTF